MKTTTALLNAILTLAFLLPAIMYGQSKVAITIDDVPNTIKYQRDHFEPVLLSKLDSLDIPVTIFVTVGLLYKTDSTATNMDLLTNWMARSYTTVGYHSYHHPIYSAISTDSLKRDFEKGEQILQQLAGKYNKPVRYFRFPFNDLGKDSAQHVDAETYIRSKKYITAPFTVESEDWVFNYIYEYYLNKQDSVRAGEIARGYISKTLALFDFFDSLAIARYGRKINQIYLCHDNTINADWLPILINELKKRNYSFLSFDEALQDPVYHQEALYYKKWGISWLYRWMKDPQVINTTMKQEPENDISTLYEQIKSEQNTNLNHQLD